jgi:hypothetical protein
MSDWDWRAHVEHNIIHDQVRIYLYQRLGDRREFVNGDGTTFQTEVGLQLPEEVGVRIPREAWDALVEYAAGLSHLGAEVRVLREWLKCERERVDRSTGGMP